ASPTASPSASPSASASPPAPSALPSGARVTVGFKNDQPNVSQLSPGTDVPTGFEPTLTNSVLHGLLGYQITYSPISVSSWQKKLDDRTIQLAVSAISYTSERQKSYIFAGPYLKTNLGVLVSKDSTLTAAQVSTLHGLSVCYENDTTAAKAVDQLAVPGSGINKLGRSTAADCLKDLQQNPDEVFVSDGIILRGLSISSQGADYRFIPSSLVSEPQEYVIALRPDEVAECLAIDKALGSYLSSPTSWYNDFQGWFVDKAGSQADYENEYKPAAVKPEWCTPSSSQG
ncbi:transporter substrate-binding domain-containing protein, partial [Kitasatospora sp. NPDC058965]|uniref:transporter substrate-binding domain-containing protein n=1 Tax=Kitasatospora sp. NPDC058965 TaxID=3346682 RepID=UPI00367CD781